MIFTGDSLARADVLNQTQHNGYKGCPYCLHDGTIVEGQVRYCNRNNGPLRTNEGSRNDMRQAQMQKRKVNGYHGISVLMAINNFDVVWQVAIDKMHNIDMGVAKKIMNLILDDKNKRERYNNLNYLINFNFELFIFKLYSNCSYYIGNYISELDKRINSIQLPKSIRKNVRSLSERLYWKAHEWKYFLLFIVIPILRGILPDR